MVVHRYSGRLDSWSPFQSLRSFPQVTLPVAELPLESQREHSDKEDPRADKTDYRCNGEQPVI